MDTLIIDSQLIESIKLGGDALHALADSLPGGIRGLGEKMKPVEEGLTIKEIVEIASSVATTLAFLYLLWQDFRKSRKIDYLERLAGEAKNQVNELSNLATESNFQTKELGQMAREAQNQTEQLMKMNKSFAESLNFKIIESRPFFKFARPVTMNYGYKVRLFNLGKRARIKDIRLENCPVELTLKTSPLPSVAPENETIEVMYQHSPNINLNQISFSLVIEFLSDNDVLFSQKFIVAGIEPVDPIPAPIQINNTIEQ